MKAENTRTGKILIIDDEELFREDLALLLKKRGFSCFTAPDARQGLSVLSQHAPDVVLLDIVMPGQSGIELLPEIFLRHPRCHVIVMTAFGTLETAIEAFRRGATDYIMKPIVLEDVLQKIHRILELQQLRREVEFLRRQVHALQPVHLLIGQSPAIERVRHLIAKVAPTRSTVLISGESGTGKELVARSIHQQSQNREAPFVALNCSGIPDNLLESELFGYQKGAFTGANRDKEGFFELAGEGTLFLDEIGELPLALQSKLLRALETREVYRVGGTQPYRFKARIVAATNKNLKTLVEQGQFREDLYYRIAVFEIHMPPLRERPEDIPLLANHFLKHLNREMKRTIQGIDAEALQVMMQYPWPGNVRELRNVLERAMILADGPFITTGTLPEEFLHQASPPASENLKEVMRAFERAHILRILQACGGNKEQAARRLGINPSTLYRKLADLNIESPD
ncbi:MAG: sigma-54-dependent Fis family transcriptional regulator [Calditrichaeota bacterium]|nr:MAG: sigma-54-dependent Fis family transcriptional regulator [Calditrichota bacterium]